MLAKPETATIHVSAAALRDCLTRVRHAQSTEEVRFYLNGVYVHVVKDKLVFVATDGHRLVRAECDFNKGDDGALPLPVILPSAFVAEIIKATSKRHSASYLCPLTISANLVKLYVPAPGGKGEEIEAVPVDGTFPDYVRVIPQTFTRDVRLHRENTLMACASLAAAAKVWSKHDLKDSQAAHARFEFSKTTKQPQVEITLDALDADVELKLHATVNLPVEKGDAEATEPFVIGLDCRYLADALKAFECVTVILKLDDKGSPVLLVDAPRDSHASEVIMPIRLPKSK